MSEAKPGLVKIGVVALSYALAGCSGAEVSAGSEGNAINLGRCYGADCGVRAQSLSGTGADARPCGDGVARLEDPLVFESIPDAYQVLAVHEAPDGTVWAVQSVRRIDDGYARIVLTRFSSDGALLATSDVIGTEEEHTLLDTALAVDSTGVATVGLYTSYAPNADVDLQEELTLYGFDQDLQPLGVSRTFRGMATPRLVGGADGSVWLAGNAFGNAAHGAVARITQREPDWIQTAVPTAGQSVGGVSGLTVADDGVSAVVARLNPRWSGEGPNIVKLGLATFDAAGTPIWTLELPGDYTQGFLGSLGGSAAGNLIVAGMVGENNDEAVVRSVSRSGELGWAYSLQGAFGVDVEAGRHSERALVRIGRGLAVIDGAGDSCRMFSAPGLLGGPAPAFDGCPPNTCSSNRERTAPGTQVSAPAALSHPNP
jgi:hypothetical protein